MKIIRFISFLLIIGLPVFTQAQSKEYKALLSEYYNDFPTISCSTAKKKLDNENVYFLDTREYSEFKVSHIKGAKRVGYDNFKMSSLKGIKKDAEIIVYCSIGARSQDIGEKLKKAGYTNVKNLFGGFFHWNNSGYEKVDSNGKKTSKIHGFSKEWSKWITKGTIVY